MAARHFARPHVRAHLSRVLPFALIFSALLIGSWLVTSITASVAAVGTITVVKVPDGAAVGEPLAQQPVFNLTGSSSTTVTCSVSGGDGLAVLSGQTAAVIGTTATFTNLTFTAGTVTEIYTLSCQGSDTDVYTTNISMEALPATMYVVQASNSGAYRWVNGTVLATYDTSTIWVNQQDVESKANSSATGGGVTLKSTVEIKVNGSIGYSLPRFLTFKTKKYTQGGGSVIDTAGGNFTIWSTNPSGGNQGAGATPISPVEFGAGPTTTSVSTGGGSIWISGGPAGSTTPVFGDIPVLINQSRLSTTGGNISIYAQVVANNSLSADWSQVGVLIDGGLNGSWASLTTGNAGNITIDVLSDVGNLSRLSAGVLLTARSNANNSAGYSNISTANGNVSITATPVGYDRATRTFGSSVNPVTYGVAVVKPTAFTCISCMNSTRIAATGTGAVSVTGVSGASNSGNSNIYPSASVSSGVFLGEGHDSGTLGVVRTVGGAISIVGDAGGGTNAADAFGVRLVGGSGTLALQATGSGPISIDADGTDSTYSGTRYAAYVNSGIDTLGGSVSITTSRYQQSMATVATHGGNFTVTATNKRQSSSISTNKSNTNAGLITTHFLGTTVSTSGGNIIIRGGSSDTDRVLGDIPVKVNGSILDSGTGSISIYTRVVANDTLTANYSQVGLYLVPQGASIPAKLVTSGIGAITVNVVSDTGANTHLSAGVLIEGYGVDGTASVEYGTSLITTVDGPISITSTPENTLHSMNAVTYGVAISQPQYTSQSPANVKCVSCMSTSGISSSGLGTVTIDATAGSTNIATGSIFSFVTNTSTTSSITWPPAYNSTDASRTITAGVFVGGSSSFIKTNNGKLSLKGTSSSTYATQKMISAGVLVGSHWNVVAKWNFGSSSVFSTGSGEVWIEGRGGSTGNAGDSYGVLGYTGASIYSGSNKLTIRGFGGNASGANVAGSASSIGVFASMAPYSLSGEVEIYAVGGTAAGDGSLNPTSTGFQGCVGNSSWPVLQKLTINATGGNVTTASGNSSGNPASYGWRNDGCDNYVKPSLTSTITGTGGAVDTYDSYNSSNSVVSFGIYSSRSLTNSGTAELKVIGAGGTIQSRSTTGFYAKSFGVFLDTSKTWDSTGGGNLSIEGTPGVINQSAGSQYSANTGYGMQGIRLSGMALSASAGAGAISVKGLAPSAGTGNVNAMGIYLEFAATSKISTSSGLIHIEGTAAQTSAKDTIGSTGVWNAGYTIGGTTSVSPVEVIGNAGINTSTTSAYCAGIRDVGTYKSSSGSITFQGNGCTHTGVASYGENIGVSFHGITVTNVTGATTINGQSGKELGGNSNATLAVGVMAAVAANSSSKFSLTSSSTGSLTITGTNHADTAIKSATSATGVYGDSALTGAYGVMIMPGGPAATTATIASTGTGQVKISGTGTNTNGAAGLWLGGARAISTLPFVINSQGAVILEGTGQGTGGFGVGLNMASSDTNASYAKIGESATSLTITAQGTSSGKGSSSNPSAGLYVAGYQRLGGGTGTVTINTDSYYAFGASATAQLPMTLGTSGAFSLLPIGSDFADQFAFDKSISAANTPIELSLTTSSTPTASTVWTVGKAGVTKNLKLISDISLGTAGTFRFLGGSLVQSSAKVLADKVGLQVSGPVWMNNANSIGTVAISSTDPSSIHFINGRSTWTAEDVGGITAVYGIPVELSIVPTQPTTGSAGLALASDIKIGSKDFYGYAVASENTKSNNIGTVTAALATSPNGSTLSGTTSATVSSGVATFSNIIGDLAGDYTITFSATGFTSVTSSTITLTVAKVAQATLVLVTSSTTGPYNSTISLSTSGGSGTGVVSYALGVTDTCTISGTTLTLASNAGTTCSVTATKATDAQYLVATSTAVSITITKADQAALTVTSTSGAYNSVLSLTVSGGTTGGTVTYVKDSTGCSLTSSSLTLNSDAGTTCAVTATMAGNSNYNAVSSSSTTITISKANQAALTVTSTSGSYNSVLGLTFSGGTTGGAVTFVKDSAGCALSGSDLTLSSNAGTTCAVTATMAGNTNYNAVSSSSTSITITRATQSAITVTSATNVVWGTNLTLTYSGGNSTSTAVWAATGTKCSVSGNVLSSTGGGDCVVSVTLPQDTNYTSATSADFTVTLDRKSQSILNWDSSVPSSIDYLSTATLAVTGGNSSGTVVYTKSNFSTCSVALNVVTAGDAGSVCRIIATKIGDDDYLSVDSAAKVFTINKISQTTLAFSNGNTFVYGQTLSLLANGGSGDGLIAYSVTTSANPNTAGCQITNGALTATSSGTCDVQAQRASSTNYLASTATTQTITISTATQAISFTSTVPATPIAGGSYSITASASSGLTVVFTTNSSACSVSGTQVSFVTSGSCVVQAAQAGDSRYQSASPITQTIVIGSRNQTLTFTSATTNITSKAFGSPAFVISATSTEADAVVTYSLNSATSNSSCTVTSGGVVVVNFVGSCVIDANAAGTASYVAASTITHTVAIVPDLASAPFIMSTSAGNRAITASFLPPTYLGGSAISGYVLRAVDQANSSNVIAETGCSYSLVNSQATCTVNGLVNGVTYKVQVAAVTAGGVGDFSELSGSLVAATNPAAVQQLSVAESNNSLVISWDDPDNLGGGSFTEYRIFIKPSASANYDQVHFFTSSPMTTRSKTVSTVTPSGTALSNGTPYDVKIVTVTSANSTEMTANTSQVNKIPRTTPDAPVVVQPVLAGSQLLISWNVPVSDGGSAISSYGVVFNGQTITPSQPTATFVLLPAPSAGGSYPYQVFATNVAGTSAPATGVFTVALPPTPGAGGGSVSGGGSNNSDAVARAQQAARTPVAPSSASPTPVGADGFSAKPDAAAPQQNSVSAPLNSNNEGSSTSAIDDFWMLLLIVLAALAAVITVAFIAVRITRGS